MRPQVCSSHLSLKGLGKSWERRLALKQPQAQVTYLWYQASLLHFPCGLGSVSVLWSPSVGMSSGKWTPWHIFLALWRDGESVQPFNQAQWVGLFPLCLLAQPKFGVQCIPLLPASFPSPHIISPFAQYWRRAGKTDLWNCRPSTQKSFGDIVMVTLWLMTKQLPLTVRNGLGRMDHWNTRQATERHTKDKCICHCLVWLVWGV